LSFGGRLPHRLDAKSLETFGETFLGETINPGKPAFTAHPRVDPVRERLVGFSTSNMAVETDLYEYDKRFAQLGKTRSLREVRGLVHDFAITQSYCVFY
ncbi:unnamed protein product, partial [Discosporangium mesarthrocarpum]